MDVFVEKFGKDAGKAAKDLLMMHNQAIKFLTDSRHVDEYLEGKCRDNLENTVLQWRSQVPWFDCALLFLEGFEIVNRYDKRVKEEAYQYLCRHYRPQVEKIIHAAQNENSFQGLWGWLLSQGNPLINSFLKTWREAYATAFPLTSAATTYENGAPYQNVKFAVHDEECVMACQISFYWITGQEFMPDKTWGKIELKQIGHKINKEAFTIEHKKQFLSILSVGLYKNTVQNNNVLVHNLKCNHFGEFLITEQQEEIRTALNKNMLACSLNLSRHF